MGRQTVHFALGLSAVSGVLVMVGLSLPMHSKGFFLAGLARAATLRIWTFMGIFDLTGSDLCSALRAAGQDDLDLCEDLGGSHDLLDLSQRVCTDVMRLIFRNGCTAMSNAYAVGMALLLLAIISILLQGIATWLLYHYMYNNPKKQYREVALVLVSVGASLLGLALMAYYPLVSSQIDSVHFSFGIHWIMDASRGSIGVHYGYWVLWLAVLVQVAQIVLYKFSKISDERRLVELKMQEQFEAELAMSNMSEGADWTGEHGGHGGGYPLPPGQQPPSWGPAFAAAPPEYGSQPGYGCQPGYGQQQPQQQGYGGYNAY